MKHYILLYQQSFLQAVRTYLNHCQNDLNTPSTYSFRLVVWLRCTIGNLIVSLSSPSAFASSAICSKMPALRISMILLKAKKLTQLAANAIIIAQRSEYLAATATTTKANTRPVPQAIWQYQKTSSKEEGEAKRAQYTHTSSSLEVSTVQDACRYFLPTFLVSQNSRPEQIVTKTHAICWVHTSPKMKSSSKTRALAADIWRRGHLLGQQLVEARLLEVLPLQTTDEIIIIVHRYTSARDINQHLFSRCPYILNHSLICQSHLPPHTLLTTLAAISSSLTVYSPLQIWRGFPFLQRITCRWLALLDRKTQTISSLGEILEKIDSLSRYKTCLFCPIITTLSLGGLLQMELMQFMITQHMYFPIIQQ